MREPASPHARSFHAGFDNARQSGESASKRSGASVFGMVLISASIAVVTTSASELRSGLFARHPQLTQRLTVNSTATPESGSFDTIFNNGFEDPCTEDADRDGLADCVETNTGIYNGPNDTGTDPRNPDTDGDGLTDYEEVYGTSGGLDLPAMGVNPNHKDILIEYDWFVDSNGCALHSHRPTQTEIQDVHDFFANAPVSNPDGSNGINIIQDYGQGGAFTGGNQIIDSNNPDGVINGNVFATQYQNYEAANFASNRHGYFHYVIMAHEYMTSDGNTSSGYAAIPGHEMMITLGCDALYTTSPTPEYTRNAIIHELGHNLGLRHGGDEDCNYKPNYNSTMNYAYEFLGVDTNCDGIGDNYTPGFSNGSRLLLDENNLNENAGMCSSTTVPIDWNEDGTLESSITYDINNYGTSETNECGGTLTVLHDYDDWANLQLYSVSQQLSNTAKRLTVKGVSCATIPPVR